MVSYYLRHNIIRHLSFTAKDIWLKSNVELCQDDLKKLNLYEYFKVIVQEQKYEGRIHYYLRWNKRKNFSDEEIFGIVKLYNLENI